MIPEPSNLITDVENYGMYQYTFNDMGIFPYYCGPHCSNGMIGQINVLDNPTHNNPTPSTTASSRMMCQRFFRTLCPNIDVLL